MIRVVISWTICEKYRTPVRARLIDVQYPTSTSSARPPDACKPEVSTSTTANGQNRDDHRHIGTGIMYYWYCYYDTVCVWEMSASTPQCNSQSAQLLIRTYHSLEYVDSLSETGTVIIRKMVGLRKTSLTYNHRKFDTIYSNHTRTIILSVWYYFYDKYCCCTSTINRTFTNID